MTRKRPRCIIRRCPWPAKYSFGIEGYYECWLHGGKWEPVWDFFSYPVRRIYWAIWRWLR